MGVVESIKDFKNACGFLSYGAVLEKPPPCFLIGAQYHASNFFPVFISPGYVLPVPVVG